MKTKPKEPSQAGIWRQLKQNYAASRLPVAGAQVEILIFIAVYYLSIYAAAAATALANELDQIHIAMNQNWQNKAATKCSRHFQRLKQQNQPACQPAN